MRKVSEYHKKRIEKQNKKYPLMEYFLSDTPLQKCSDECEKQVKEIIQGNWFYQAHSFEWALLRLIGGNNKWEKILNTL